MATDDDNPMVARIVGEARRALPRDKVIGAFSGTVRPSPGLSSLLLAVVAVGVTAALVVGLQMTPLVAVPIAVVAALGVAAALGAFATELVIFAVTTREIVVLELARGAAGSVLARLPRRIEVDRYWDPRWKKIRAGSYSAYVNVRAFGPAVDALVEGSA